MQILLDKPYEISDIEKSDELELRNITENNFHVVLQAKRCVSITLYNARILDLAGIEKLPMLRHLRINWATKLKGIEEIEGLTNLESLELTDLPKLRSIGPLTSLQRLRELKIGGGMWKPIRLETLEPVAKLSLSKLSVTNIRLDDDDIKIISEISTLSDLDISNQFPREQYAYLAAKLNHKLNNKIQAFMVSPIQCPSCKANKFMFMGRRLPFLCEICDKKRFERHKMEFEEEIKKWSRN